MGGLITATLLTLFVLPALYNWFSPRVVRDGAEAMEGAGS